MYGVAKCGTGECFFRPDAALGVSAKPQAALLFGLTFPGVPLLSPPSKYLREANGRTARPASGVPAVRRGHFMPDATTTVAALREAMQRFVDERDWRQFHSPKNLVMGLAVEAAELMEHFLWVDNAESLRV